RRRHTRFSRDWSSDVCSSDLSAPQDPKRRVPVAALLEPGRHRIEHTTHGDADAVGSCPARIRAKEWISLNAGMRVKACPGSLNRSEERRVGKEGREWWVWEN